MNDLFRFDKKRATESPSDDGNGGGLVGIDEAGRGCFAGPVVAGAVWVKSRFYAEPTPIRHGKIINDSKQLSPTTREEIFALIEFWERRGELVFSAGIASVKEIEERNILGATKLAMARAVDGILKKLPAGTPCPFAAAGTTDVAGALLFATGAVFPPMLIDGRPLSEFAWQHKAIVRGDATSLAVALASIVAKVSRDRLMCELDAKFPGYGFSEHKGYGTAAHIAAIRAHGITPLHRMKFLRNLAASSHGKIPGLEALFPRDKPPPEQREFAF